MRDELDLLAIMTNSPDKYRWETPIRYAITTSFDYMVKSDSCLTGWGAFCPELKFRHNVQWLPEVVCWAVKFTKKRSPNLIFINFLEQATLFLSRNAVLDAMFTSKDQHPPHPKSLMRVDNTNTDTRTHKIAASSDVDKRLIRLFYSLLINQMLGLDS